MGKVTAHMSISLDGFIAGPNDSVENPLGDNGMSLHTWAINLMSWREQHGLEGGVVNEDTEIEADVTRNVGAVVMGRRMFHNDGGPWTEPLWPGFWGENPPFHVPVFVVTHHPRPSLEMGGGTIFHFVTAGLKDAIAQAREVAGEKNVDIAGGAHVVREAIRAGLLDQLVLHHTPVLLGSGIRLFENIGDTPREIERDYVVPTETTTHIKYRFKTPA